jgi:hypothetical protein
MRVGTGSELFQLFVNSGNTVQWNVTASEKCDLISSAILKSRLFRAEKPPFQRPYFLVESDLGIFRALVRILPVTCLPVLEEGGYPDPV